ncbi:MAG TPA: tripartite tricarboxylate transporter TctB family protein [Burkholderiaceae bacterium]|nr:tripartite tricarboxylate transporter TctB family protein [Burkholderiaceae bacterium]
MQIRNAQDFWSGVLFAAFGAFFIIFAREYDMGSAARMGPAFFPTMLGGLLVLLGILVGARSLAAGAGDGKISRFHFKPLLLVLGAVIAFGVLLRPGGLLVALAALVGISSLGGDQFRLRDVVLLTILLALLVLAVFIWGLGMTIPVLPAFMQD